VHRLLALYFPPDDVGAFRKHYEEVHVPLVKAMPGIRAVNYTFDARVLHGEAKYALIFEAEFDDREALRAALESPEGAKAAADLANFASGGVVLLDYELRH
jgi:uncharacterized protein (TIGR02118 family)